MTHYSSSKRSTPKGRPCKTVIVNSNVSGTVPFKNIEIGTAFIRPSPTNKNDPCVYYKTTSLYCIHQGGTGHERSVDPTDLIIPVKVVETHIELPEGCTL